MTNYFCRDLIGGKRVIKCMLKSTKFLPNGSSAISQKWISNLDFEPVEIVIQLNPEPVTAEKNFSKEVSNEIS